MPAHVRCSDKSRLARFVPAITGAVLTIALGACADTHWERAIYQGWQYNQQSCGVTRRAADPPCVKLPPYEAYVKERDAIRSQLVPPPSVESAAK